MENSSDRIRVLIADDHRVVRELVKPAIASECEIVGEASDGESTVALALRTRPHIILLDLVMRGADGLSVAHELARKLPGAKVLVVSQYNNREYVLEAVKEAGVAGYFLKSEEGADNILPAIRAVHSGGQYFSPSIARILVEEMNHPSYTRGGDGLTKREREVLRLIAEGSTTKDIAARLKISPKTAQVHRDNLKQKLNLRSTAAIVRYAIQRKMVRID
ncbi:MAG TPA: response regulator transcription factor [Candidatus Binataceae bacterium]|nr:response regulator transcription factor [Candidatus Binataceae bacterium]